jgi:hypothetical protein
VLEESTGTLFVGAYLSDVKIPNICVSSVQYEASLVELEPFLESGQIQRMVPATATLPISDRGAPRIEASRHSIAEVRRAITQQDAQALGDGHPPSRCRK